MKRSGENFIKENPNDQFTSTVQKDVQYFKSLLDEKLLQVTDTMKEMDNISKEFDECISAKKEVLLEFDSLEHVIGNSGSRKVSEFFVRIVCSW